LQEKKKRFAASFTLSASSSHDLSKSAPIDQRGAELALKRFQEAREEICANLFASVSG
jgi:hypothetical protein